MHGNAQSGDETNILVTAPHLGYGAHTGSVLPGMHSVGLVVHAMSLASPQSGWTQQYPSHRPRWCSTHTYGAPYCWVGGVREKNRPWRESKKGAGGGRQNDGTEGEGRVCRLPLRISTERITNPSSPVAGPRCVAPDLLARSCLICLSWLAFRIPSLSLLNLPGPSTTAPVVL